MKLRDARLCLDCDEVYSAEDAQDGCCPSCGSKAAYLLSKAIPTIQAFEQSTVEITDKGLEALKNIEAGNAATSPASTT